MRVSNPRDLNDTSTSRFHSTRERETNFMEAMADKKKHTRHGQTDVELVYETNINATLGRKQKEKIFAPPAAYLNQLQIFTQQWCVETYTNVPFSKVLII